MAKPKKETPHPLVGTVLKGEKQVHTHVFGNGDTWDSVSIKLDESAYTMLEEYFGRQPRVKMPGYMYTADCKPGRVNVCVDENLTIYDVHNG